MCEIIRRSSFSRGCSIRPKAVVHLPKPIALKQSFTAARAQEGFQTWPDERGALSHRQPLYTSGAIFVLYANGQTAAGFLEKITSRGSDLHPPAAPRGERYALSREERAGTHRISRLFIQRTIPAICIGLCRFCNVIAPSRGRIIRIQCRQVCSSATDKETCNRNERACNQAALHQRTPCNHSIHVHGPLGNHVPDPVQSTEPDQ
jgi:hypothetical protein